jgi:hypothetical protein
MGAAVDKGIVYISGGRRQIDAVYRRILKQKGH